MTLPPALTAGSSFQELSPRERLAVLFDVGHCTELLGPFDRITSPWLEKQGSVAQSDDGVVAVLGTVNGRRTVGVATDARHEGGSVGEVGGAKIVTALRLAVESCGAGVPMTALLLLETGGVRLQEANLGLDAIAAIHAAIVQLRHSAPVIAVIAGPVGCFGGMSLAAELCTTIVATRQGRLGMNGAEVIEQEAGPQELDASDHDLIRQITGCEARLRDGFIDVLVEDESQALRSAVHKAICSQPGVPLRLQGAYRRLNDLRASMATGSPQRRSAIDPFADPGVRTVRPDRGRLWLQRLGGGNPRIVFGTSSILEADVPLGDDRADNAFALAIVRDENSILPRAAHGELGLEQAWTLAERIRSFVSDERDAIRKRPILAIVDSPGQAFGRIEEERCISLAAAAAIDAYTAARRNGHIILTLVVGRAMSGSFLVHGMQSDHIAAFDDEGVSMQAMNLHSVARITRRTLEEVESNAAAVLPMSYAIRDAYRLGVVDALLSGIQPDKLPDEDLQRVTGYLSDRLAALRRSGPASRNIEANPYRKGTAHVHRAMREQWAAFQPQTTAGEEQHGTPHSY